MGYKKQAQSVRITDTEAVNLINQRATRENRTAANAATVTICEALKMADNHTATEIVNNLNCEV